MTDPIQRSGPSGRDIDGCQRAPSVEPLDSRATVARWRRDANPSMLNSVIGRTVDFCTRNARLVIIVGIAFAAVSGLYTARHFAVNTDLANLISSNLPWRQRELAYEKAFPQSIESIIAVVHAPTPELAGAAASAVTERLSGRSDLFHSVRDVAGGAFFERNGLLFLPIEQLTGTMHELTEAAPLIRVLAADPSLRGLTQALSLSLLGLRLQRYSLDDMSHSLNMTADTIEEVLAGRSASFSWKVLLSGQPPKAEELRRIIRIWAKLDYAAVQPGHRATAAIRKAAERANIASEFNADLRLTGSVPITDQELIAVQEGGASVNNLVAAGIVLVILWLAMRSVRTVLAIVATLSAGLAIAAALGLIIVGRFNPISVAFAILFVGLGSDFAIQYSIRYRSERHVNDDLHSALVKAAERVGTPLTLAASSAAAGFLSFLPTSYRGLAELGLISGCGMVVAYVASLTLLPALLQVVHPPPEPRPLGYAALAPVDRFLQKHRFVVVAATAIVSVTGLPLLWHLQFDFDPLHLRNPNEEAVATYRELSKDPLIGRSAAEVLAETQAKATEAAKRLAAVPAVAQTRTVETFIPPDQDHKLTIIRDAARTLEPSLNPPASSTPPTDEEKIAALKNGAQDLTKSVGQATGPGASAATRLAGDLNKLAAADATVRAAAEFAMVRPLTLDLEELRQALKPQRVTLENLPADIRRDWIAPDGQARAEATPKQDTDDNQALRQFALAVLAAEPDATGPAISTFEWADAMIGAFIQAAAWALCSIAFLLWIVLRRAWDVVLTLVPLLVAAAVTLEICSLLNFPLNYANIIALPILLGVGVAFKIYYVLAWRRGETNFLQSPLTRAVFFSALMTATAFGSLWLSSHPGLSSMGKLLALSLACTLASAALFQPALMGPPRQKR